MKNLIIILFFLISYSLVSAQDYTEGFNYLEQGEFEKGKIFFKNQLDQGRDDVTVRLCYGRALGLSGSPVEANTLFKNLVTEYPDNYELKLNYAESYMWSKKYPEAKNMYIELTTIDSTSFPAVLGYANALSSLKEYDLAAIMVEKARIIDPTNLNAKVSRKYIRMGLAESKKLKSLEPEALIILENLYLDHPKDLDVGMALSYLYMDSKDLNKAETTLQALRRVHGDKKRILSALSTIRLRQLDYTQAIGFINFAKEDTGNIENLKAPTDLQTQRINTYISAKQFEEAEILLKQLDKNTADSLKIDGIRLNLLLGERQYNKALSLAHKYRNTEFYHQIKTRIPLQQGNIIESTEALKTLHDKYPNSVFHYYIAKELDKASYTHVKPEFTYIHDNGGNDVLLSSLLFESTNTSRFQFVGSATRRTSTQFEEDRSTQQTLSAGLKYTIDARVSMEAHAGINSASLLTESTATNGIFNTKLAYKISELQYINTSFRRTYYDYNVALINSSIYENRLALEYYNVLQSGQGVYLNIASSSISDSNSSNFTYLSFFQNFTELPLFQVGLNLQRLAFRKLSEVYFSPESYKGAEVFSKYDNRYHPIKKWVYSLTGAFGLQSINSGDLQTTQRVEAEFGYKLNEISWIMAFYRFNNSFSASTTGFQVTSIGVSCVWKL